MSVWQIRSEPLIREMFFCTNMISEVRPKRLLPLSVRFTVKKQQGVRLLARNVSMTFVCCECGDPAELIDTEDYDSENPFYC